jgi:NAD(P)-dependent dehydrogenase (short-subunit alcohol dehydrogenase family)
MKNLKKKKKLYDWTISKTPQKRWGTSEEISDVVIFLLSNNSTYIKWPKYKY